MIMEPKKFLSVLKANMQGQDNTPSVETMREEFDREGKRNPIVDGVTAQSAKLGSIPCICLEAQTISDNHILYLHGGGYAGGSPKSHKGMTSALPAKTGMKLWSLDYRLAPEHPFPAAIEDVVSAYTALIEIVGSSERIVIAGDSAGGGLTVASMLKARELGLPMPAGLVLLSPWTNLNLDGWSHKNNIEKDFLASPNMLEKMAGWYAADSDRNDPLVSPGLADLSGLPPMLIHVGSEEILMSDSLLLAERAGGAGIPVTLKIWPDMPHVFQMFAKFLEPAERSLNEISEWMLKRF